METSLMASHVKMSVEGLLHDIDNPLGSMAVTYKAFQALKQLVKQRPGEMRNLSWTWAPPIYQKLLSSNTKIVELADSCLSGTQSVLLPPLSRLSEVVVTDIQQRLLFKMEEMLKLQGRSPCIAIQAWGWLFKLLGAKSTEEKSITNAMLKLLESSFLSPSTQVRSASQVAWVSVIDVFVPSPREAGASKSPGALSEPSKGVPLSVKRLKLLLMPLLNTMGWEKDFMIQRSCCCTWIYLLCKLGQSVNERHVFDAAVLPMLEVVFKLNKDRDESVWQACVDLLKDATSCKGFDETSPDEVTNNLKGASQPPKTPAGITYTGVYSESHHKNIKWSSWHLDRLHSFIKAVHLLWTSGIQQRDEVKTEDGHPALLSDSFEASRECWSLLVRGVEAEGRNSVRPSSDHVTAVHLLLKFLSEICADVPSKNLLVLAWTLIEILIDGFGLNVIASSFYRIRLQFRGHTDFVQETYADCGPYSDSSRPDAVTPIVYISAAWFKLVFETWSVGQNDNMWLQPVKKLINTGRAGFDVMGNYLGFAWTLDHLAKESHLHREESSGIRKGDLGDSKCVHVVNRNWYFLLELWKIVEENLRELVERSNDVAPVRGSQRDSGYQVASDVLLFPIMCFLMFSPRGDQLSKVELCGNCAQSHDRNLNHFGGFASLEAELLSTEGGWFKLFDCVLRISSLKNPQPNSFIGGFFHRVMKVMKSSFHEQAQELPGAPERLKFESSRLSNPCLTFLGDIVAHAMKHAEISNLAMLAISRKRRKTGFGASSVRVQCIGGMELEDANNLKNILSVAGRLLTLSYVKYTHDKMQSSLLESVVRVLGALTSLMHNITSQNDSVLLLQALAQPLSYWLDVDLGTSGFRADGTNQARRPLPGFVLEGLAQAWDALLYCLQTCRPSLAFDSKLLLVQGSSLAPAFVHHHDAISNRTLEFWESTYGAKAAANLDYPPVLDKVLSSVKHKVDISLPGWATRQPAAAKETLHDAPQRLYRPPHSKVRQFKDLIQSKRNTGEKLGVTTREDRQTGSSGSEELKFVPADLLGTSELGRHTVNQQTTQRRQPSDDRACTEDTAKIQCLVNDASDTSPEQQSEFMPTPEGNALIDELVNTHSASQLTPEELFKSISTDQSVVPSAQVFPTEVPVANEDMQAGAEDSQAVELPSMEELMNVLQASEFEPQPEERELASFGDKKKIVQTKEIPVGYYAAQNVEKRGPTVDLATPPIAINDISADPPKLPMGAERPKGNINGGVVQVAATGGRKLRGSQGVSNLPQRRKKLKFLDDSQEVDYVVIPQSLRKRAGPFTDRQREVRLAQRTGGLVMKTYTRADFSQSGGGYADEFLESQAAEAIACKENIPPSNLRRSRESAAFGEEAANCSKVEKVGHNLRKDDPAQVDEGIKIIPLDKVDYIQLKSRLATLVQNDATLTYPQVFDLEHYEYLPRLIQARLTSQFCKLRKKFNNVDQPESKKADCHPHRGSEQSPSGGKTNKGKSRALAADEGREEPTPSTFLSRKIPDLHRCSKRPVKSMPGLNLRSSGKLRGGKHWRTNAELRKVLTARLGMKPTRQRVCRRNLGSNVERLPPSADVEEDIVAADCGTKCWGKQMRVCTKHNLENPSIHHPAHGVVKSPSQLEEDISFNDKEKMTAVHEASLPTTDPELNTELQENSPFVEVHDAPLLTANPELSTELHENSPFQVRNLNRGLLAKSFCAAHRIVDDLSAQHYVNQATCKSTRANSHYTRKCRAPKRVPSGDNSLDANLSQFRVAERSVSEREDASTNGGLLAESFCAPRRIVDDLSAQQDYIQAVRRSTRANSHHRKCRAPKRVQSEGNSLDAYPSQFRGAERSVSEREDAATTSGVHGSESMCRRNSESTNFAPPSYLPREDLENGCSSVERPASPLIFVCLRGEGSPLQPHCVSSEDRDGNIPAFFCEKRSQPESTLNTGVCSEGSAHGVPSGDEDFTTPAGILNLVCQSDAKRGMLPGELGADRRQSQSHTELEVQPQESPEDSGNAPINEVQALLERKDVQVCHVLSALLASSKWEKMRVAEVFEVDKLLGQLKEAVVGYKGEPRMFITPTHS